MVKKICIDCNIEKDISEYNKTKRWYRNRCKKCHNLKFQPPTGKPNLGRFKKAPEHIRRIKICLSLIRSLKNIIRNLKRRSIKYKEWVEAIKKRDNYKCTLCSSMTRLHIHHIIPWKANEQLRFEISNGKTLCISCHAKLEGYQKGHKPHSNSYSFKKGMIPWNKGKNMSFESKKKMSDSRKKYLEHKKEI